MASHPLEATPPALVMDCSGCGTKIKVKAELAGKKCKCPRCGQILSAPLNLVAPSPPIWKVIIPPLLLGLVLWSTFILKLYNLDHTGLTRWDEVFHAIVARNAMKHPLKPTLVD